MLDLLIWLEGSALGNALRGAGVWTYSFLNLGHIFGISTLFGSILVLDLRMLGLWRSIPLAAVRKPTVPLAGIGFVLAVATGISMITVNATDYYGNPFLYIKLPVILVGVINVIVLEFLPAWRAVGVRELSTSERRQLAAVGGFSLLCWVVVIGTGRMIGYW